MVGWTIALGLGAGYLMNKNLQMDHRLQESVKAFNSAAEPDEKLPTEQIREVQRRVPDADKYEDMNLQDLDRKDVDGLVKERERAHQEVQAYESGPPPIEGVYLVMDNHGV